MGLLMSTEHTLGPWRITFDRKYPAELAIEAVVDGNIVHIALVHGVSTDEETQANAALIAAAPDLLESARAVAAFLAGPKDRFGRVDPAANDDARAARERIRDLAVRYGMKGSQTYLDQCAAVLSATIAKAEGRDL
jgi:hypothetical protein